MTRPAKILSRALAASAFVAGLLSLTAPAGADAYFSYGFNSGRHNHWRPHYGAGYVWGPPVVVAPYYPYYPPRTVYYVPAPAPVYVAPATAPLPANATSPAYQTSDGRYCREYQSTVVVAGQPQPIFGTACLQPDGVWRIVN